MPSHSSHHYFLSHFYPCQSLCLAINPFVNPYFPNKYSSHLKVFVNSTSILHRMSPYRLLSFVISVSHSLANLICLLVQFCACPPNIHFRSDINYWPHTCTCWVIWTNLLNTESLSDSPCRPTKRSSFFSFPHFVLWFILLILLNFKVTLLNKPAHHIHIFTMV